MEAKIVLVRERVRGIATVRAASLLGMRRRSRLSLAIVGVVLIVSGVLGFGSVFVEPLRDGLVPEHLAERIGEYALSWLLAGASAGPLALGLGLLSYHLIERRGRATDRARRWKVLACGSALLLPSPIIGHAVSTVWILRAEETLILPVAGSPAPPRSLGSYVNWWCLTQAGLVLSVVGAVLIVLALWRVQASGTRDDGEASEA